MRVSDAPGVTKATIHRTHVVKEISMDARLIQGIDGEGIVTDGARALGKGVDQIRVLISSVKRKKRIFLKDTRSVP